MNKDVRVSINQSLFDIAIQQCGSVEAVFAIAELNGLSITDALESGVLLEIPEWVVVDKPITDYYKAKGLRPATDLIKDIDLGRIFGLEFPKEFA